MSLYNMMFGVNEHALPLMETLGLNPAKITRFRDCYLKKDHIVIYTRTGDTLYEEDNEIMENHPNFLFKRNDSYDPTYTSFHFSIPEPHKDALGKLGELLDTPTPEERWRQTLGD